MIARNGIIKGIEFCPSPNFDNRPKNEEIDLIVIHAISLPPKNYDTQLIRDFFSKRPDAKVFAFDPILKSKPDMIKLPSGCNLCYNLEDALKNSDIAMIFTKWEEFKFLNSELLKQFMSNPIIIDGRGFLEKEKFDVGAYFKIGYSE